MLVTAVRVAVRTLEVSVVVVLRVVEALAAVPVEVALVVATAAGRSGAFVT